MIRLMGVRRVRYDRMKGHSWAVWTAAWGVLFCITTWLVQSRLLATLDAAGLDVIADHRQLGLSDGMNWVFRLGFASVDGAMALLWAIWLSVRWKRGWKPQSSGVPAILGLVPAAVLAPLLLFAVVGVQAGLRLVVDQPAPGKAYELQRAFAQEPVSAVLDRTDAAARGSFEAAASAAETNTISTLTEGRGSYPSGHAARTLFLALLAVYYLRHSTARAGRVRQRVAAAALCLTSGLVGYSALYFGYHWPSDLLGGYLIALAAYPLAARLLRIGAGVVPDAALTNDEDGE